MQSRIIATVVMLLGALGVLLGLASAPAGHAEARHSAPQQGTATPTPGAASPSATMTVGTGMTASPTATAAATCTPFWTVMASANQTPGDDILRGVAAISPNDVWAVGEAERPAFRFDPIIEHWNGSAWSIVPSPGVPFIANALRGVAGSGTNNVWAVGSYYDGVNYEATLALHWNGTAWTQVPTVDPIPSSSAGANLFTSVVTFAPDNAWAAGFFGSGSYFDERTLIEHWNGTAWSVVPSPSVPGKANRLQALSATGPNDIWAVGFSYGDGQEASLVEHWNGSSWTIVPSPNPIASYPSLMGVTAVGPGDVWAVGSAVDAASGLPQVESHRGPRAPAIPPPQTPSHTLIEHWNGTAWTVVASPDANPGTNVLNAVAARGPNDVWAAGTTGIGCCTTRTLMEHWDGATWSLAANPSAGTGNWLNALAANSGELWAAGFRYANNAVQTLIQHYGGACPAPTPSPTACAIHFTDVPPDQPFYASVACLACQGIISGYADGTFRPSASVTRGQMAKFIANGANFTDPIPADRQTFHDVPPTDPLWLYIERVAAQRIVSGYLCGSAPAGPCTGGSSLYFLPGAAVVRSQAAKFVANAALYTDAIPAGRQTFHDVPPSHPFWAFIERAAAHGVISGYTCGVAPAGSCDTQNRPYFLGNNAVTRGQTAKLISFTFFPGCMPLNPR